MTEVIMMVTETELILLRLFRRMEPVGWMRIASNVELSLDCVTWVDYTEGVCENGMALKWDGVMCR